MHTLRDWLGGLAALVLPSTCAACSALTDDESPLCATCATTLEPIRVDHACPRCGLPAVGRVTPAPSCLGCARASPAWGSAFAPFVFGGALSIAVRRWKLGRMPALSSALGQLLAPAVLKLPSAIDALVPVPLHPRRLRAREFNQAALLARAATPRRGGPPIYDLLERTRDTPPQASLDAAARQRNMRGAFRHRRSLGVDVTRARLCLVDDVLTTGATATACALALLDAGAVRVDVLTLARALP